MAEVICLICISLYLFHNVVVGTDDNFDDLVLKADRPTIVNFWAEWCGPCKMNEPPLETSAANHPEITLVQFNIDQNPNTPSKCNVTSIPTLLAYNKGQVVDKLMGASGYGPVEEFFQKQSKLASSS